MTSRRQRNIALSERRQGTGGVKSHGARIVLRFAVASLIVLFLHPSLSARGEETGQPAEPFAEDLSGEETQDMRAEIEHFGITWTFDQEYPAGRFVTGDWWVVGPVTVKEVDPSPTVGPHGYHHHGSQLNPVGNQGYDSRSDRWDAGVSVSFPVTIAPDASLVSTVSRDITEESLRPSLEKAAVLTVLSEPPPEQSFRPGIVGRDKRLYNAENIQWEKLPNLPATQSVPADLTDLADAFERPWLLGSGSWQNRHVSPRQNMPSYHQNIASLLSRAAVVIATDRPGKEDLVVHYIQVAIDYYIMQLEGGSAYNYFFPVVFAGIMLDEPGMRNMYVDGTYNYAEYHSQVRHGASKKRVYFGADQAGFTSERLPVESKSGILLGGDTPYGQDTWTGYYARTGRKPVFYNTGPGHEELHPDEWEDTPGNAVNTYKRMHSISMVGFTLAAWAFDAWDYIDNAAYVPYTRRWMFEDDEIVTDSYGPTGGPHPYATSRVTYVDEMWHEYYEGMFED